jgi:hypothetical protein
MQVINNFMYNSNKSPTRYNSFLVFYPNVNRPDCHHNMKVKPEAATAVIELLMMGGKTPETY